MINLLKLCLLGSTLAQSLLTKKIKIAVLGDSIFEHTPLSETFANNSMNSIKVINFSMGGRTMIKRGENIEDFPYAWQHQYRDALESKPDVVILMLGTNDAKIPIWNQQWFLDDYMEMARAL
jgi:lysophospholipase L1-like esterase